MTLLPSSIATVAATAASQAAVGGPPGWLAAWMHDELAGVHGGVGGACALFAFAWCVQARFGQKKPSVKEAAG